MAEAADETGVADATGWGRAVVIPAMGSVLVAGHSPLGALVLRAAHAAASALEGGTEPLGWDEEAETVDEAEACDESDEDELERLAPRGTNRATALGPPSALHAWRLMFWKLTGGATAVIGVTVGVCCGRGRGRSSERRPCSIRGRGRGRRGRRGWRGWRGWRDRRDESRHRGSSRWRQERRVARAYTAVARHDAGGRAWRAWE